MRSTNGPRKNEELVALGECLALIGDRATMRITVDAFLFWALRYHTRFSRAARNGQSWGGASKENALRKVEILVGFARKEARRRNQRFIDASVAEWASGKADCKPPATKGPIKALDIWCNP